MTKWIPTVVTLLGTIISVMTPAILNYEKVHPQVVLILAGIYAIIKGLLPSPVSN